MKKKEIMVRKQDGQAEPFSEKKVRSALQRSGLSGREVKAALKLLYPRLYDGIRTKRIYSIVYSIIRDLRPESGHRYNLKHALQLLGPAGYEFEDFVSRLFEALGYSTKLRQVPIGKCITHEVDVIAVKGKEKLMVECKFRNEPGTRCRSQTILYVYARFLDLREGARLHSITPFSNACLVTNAKFSRDVVSYAKCMGIRLLGWRHPSGKGLEALIERTGCYPVSVLPMNMHTLRTLYKHRIITIKDVPGKPAELAELTGISASNARRIVENAKLAAKLGK